ncbi:MAG: ABC transporter permease, partial [Actinomycetota bacterium]
MKKKKTFKYWGLVRELTLTDFKLKYQGSLLGYLWSLAKPLMLFGVLLVVFTKFFRLGGTIPNYPVYLLLGVVLWTYFVESTFSTMSSIVGRGDLLRKVYCPRIILPISTSMTALVT